MSNVVKMVAGDDISGILGYVDKVLTEWGGLYIATNLEAIHEQVNEEWDYKEGHTLTLMRFHNISIYEVEGVVIYNLFLQLIVLKYGNGFSEKIHETLLYRDFKVPINKRHRYLVELGAGKKIK